MQVNYLIKELDNVPYVIQQIIDDNNVVIHEQPVDLGAYLAVSGQQGINDYVTAITNKIAQINATLVIDPNDPAGMLATAQCISNIAQNVAAFAMQLQQLQQAQNA